MAEQQLEQIGGTVEDIIYENTDALVVERCALIKE